MTKIKMCGMTREVDIAAALELGVDALGFVLWEPSPRSVSWPVLAALVRALPPFVSPVAVLVDPTVDDVRRAIESGCRIAQVHGRVDDELFDRGWTIVRAVSLGEAGVAIAPPVQEDVTILLDAHDPVRHGGTGRPIDWERAARIAERRRVVLAGGLTPANVGEAVRTVQPYAVDVASGIEHAPGLKDHDAMRAFVSAVRAADDELEAAVDRMGERTRMWGR